MSYFAITEVGGGLSVVRRGYVEIDPIVRAFFKGSVNISVTIAKQ